MRRLLLIHKSWYAIGFAQSNISSTSLMCYQWKQILIKIFICVFNRIAINQILWKRRRELNIIYKYRINTTRHVWQTGRQGRCGNLAVYFGEFDTTSKQRERSGNSILHSVGGSLRTDSYTKVTITLWRQNSLATEHKNCYLHAYNQKNRFDVEHFLSYTDLNILR